MRFLRQLLIVGGVVAASHGALAQDARGGIDALFQRLSTDEAAARALVPSWFGPVATEREGLYAGFVMRLFAEPAFADYVLDEVGPPPADTDAWLRGPVNEAGNAAVGAGIARLGPTEEAAFFATGAAFADWVAANSPDSCRMVVEGTADTDPALLALQAAYQDTRPAKELDAYLALGLAGLLAEATDTPAVNAFTDAQLQEGFAAYQAVIEAAVMADAKPQRLVDAANLLPTATAQDMCDLMLVTLTTIDEIPEPQRTWAVHFILTQQ